MVPERHFLLWCVTQNGVQLKKVVEKDEEDGMISNKKPTKAALAKEKLYGCFVKVITFLFMKSILITGTKE